MPRRTESCDPDIHPLSNGQIVLRMRSSKSSTTSNRNDPTQVFQITHPFHPRFSQEYLLVELRQNWGEDRVYYHDADNRLRSLPTSWTSLASVNPFLIAAEGRSRLHIDGVLALTRLIQALIQTSA